MVLLAANAGLRSGELRGLEWGDVDLRGQKLVVRRTAWFRNNAEHLSSPKSNRERTVDLPRRVVDALQAIRHLQGERVFYRDGVLTYTPKRMELWLKNACKRAGLPSFGWHVLRHTYCSHLAMSGADAKTIQELAGHASLGVTMRYMHLSPGHVRQAVDRLEGADATHATQKSLERLG